MSKVAEVLQALREEAARLRAELSRVERAIAALEEAMGAESSAAAPKPPLPAPAAEAGPYASLHFYQAVAQYLSSVDEPKLAREIAEALRAGGFPTRAKDFAASVRTMLSRGAHLNDLEQVDDFKWRLRSKAHE